MSKSWLQLCQYLPWLMPMESRAFRSTCVWCDRSNSDSASACVQSSKNGRSAVVAAGSNHNMLITRRGEIFAWGLSSSGELGQRDTPIDQAWPIQVIPQPPAPFHLPKNSTAQVVRPAVDMGRGVYQKKLGARSSHWLWKTAHHQRLCRVLSCLAVRIISLQADEWSMISTRLVPGEG